MFDGDWQSDFSFSLYRNSFVLGRKLPQYAAEQSIDGIINYIKQPSLAYISLSQIIQCEHKVV
jgi:hypothetical protein